MFKDPRKIAERIGEVRLLYARILDLNNEINQAFSSRLFVNMTCSFADVVFFIFADILYIKFSDESITEAETSKFYMTIVWTTNIVLKVILVGCVCDATSAKIKHTGSVVHRQFSFSMDQHIRNEVKLQLY